MGFCVPFGFPLNTKQNGYPEQKDGPMSKRIPDFSWAMAPLVPVEPRDPFYKQTRMFMRNALNGCI